MKRIIVVSLVVFFGMNYIYAQPPRISKKSFVVNIEKLSESLQLDYDQFNEVLNINDFFIEQQAKARRTSGSSYDQKKREAVYSNLKLLKKVLNEDQYRKYVALLNLTNYAYLSSEGNALPDPFLAEIK